MKKKLFLGLLAAAAVTFTACQKDEVINEVPQDQPIEFGTYVGRDAQTKGSIVETTQLEGQGFGVYAYYTGTTAIEDYEFPASPNFMNNVKVTKGDWDNNNETEKTWGYTTQKYWPNTTDDKISFYAYGPYDSTPNGNTDFIQIATSAESAPVLTYTVDNNVTNHKDILFAVAQTDKSKTNDPITFTFQHALSRIEFEIKTDIDYSNNPTITLASVSLIGNIHPSGTLNLSETSVNWNETAATSKEFTITDTRTITSSQRAVKTTAESTNDYIMIIPQAFEADDDLKLKVVYKTTYTEPSLEVTNTVTSDDIDITFEQGKAYKFIITIGLDTVDFTASVTEWNDDHVGYTTGTAIGI
ncbi:MAG: fimbrillin family protein [Bacteroidales bacterium]|nr:fimbrillin family protein [Bacteroidales bacterium]